MGAGRSDAHDVDRYRPPSSSPSSGYQSETADEVDGQISATPFRNHVLNGVCDQTSQKQIEMVKQTSRLLATDIVEFMSRSSAPLQCRHAAAMRRIVTELSSRHEILFTSIARKLNSRVASEGSPDGCWQWIFLGVAKELFADGQYNWGRVVTVYAFAGWLVRQHRSRKASSDDIGDIIASATGEFVADQLSDWIHRQGGWDTFEVFFPEQQTFESVLWRGLLFTLVALGVLAVIALAR